MMHSINLKKKTEDITKVFLSYNKYYNYNIIIIIISYCQYNANLIKKIVYITIFYIFLLFLFDLY